MKAPKLSTTTNGRSKRKPKVMLGTAEESEPINVADDEDSNGVASRFLDKRCFIALVCIGFGLMFLSDPLSPSDSSDVSQVPVDLAAAKARHRTPALQHKATQRQGHIAVSGERQAAGAADVAGRGGPAIVGPPPAFRDIVAHPPSTPKPKGVIAALSSPPPSPLLSPAPAPASTSPPPPPPPPLPLQSPLPPHPPDPSPPKVSPSPLSPSPSPLAPVAPVWTWSKHKHLNCWWNGNGAELEIDKPRGSAAPGVTTLAACKAACLEARPACEGVLFSREGKCYRKGKINVEKCNTGAQDLDLYYLEIPSPPSPPLLPPVPPRPPLARGIEAINKRFRDGRPSDRLEEVGVLMHQWDGQEDVFGKGDNGNPWKMCIANCMCQGSFIFGRISTMIIYAGLRDRADRRSVPLPFGDRGGILISPSLATVDCGYGIDGGTYRLNNPARPGCSDSFCDPHNYIDQNGNPWCGFNGAPAMAWGPNDLKALLEEHARSGPRWSNSGFHSGYNEFIVNSKAHNARLPDSVEAFFVPKGMSPVTGNLGYGIVIDVVKAHQRFLNEYGLTASEVPLVEFDPYNWNAPFSPYGG